MDIDDWLDLGLLADIIAHELRAHDAYVLPGHTRLSTVHDLIVLGTIDASVGDGRIAARATDHGWWVLSIIQQRRQ